MRNIKREKGESLSIRLEKSTSKTSAEAIELSSAYSVLAYCSGDYHCAETFEEFCREFGYDADSRKAEKTFKACQKQSVKLQKLFDTEEAREDLLKIC